jgi:hypothetical protein
MINTPVHVSTELDDDDNQIYTTEIFDADGDFICQSAHIDLTDEILKRINMHDELVMAVKTLLPVLEMFSFSDSDYTNIVHLKKLLEKCK